MPRVSVIIPVYNVEAWLADCLDSVLSQSLADIEVICVEDCSTDGSAAILRRYAAQDARIRVLWNGKNGGLSFARNRGLAEARGEYIQFVDSDDLLTPGALACLYETAAAQDLDLVKSAFCFYRDGRRDGAQTYPAALTERVIFGDELLFRFERERLSLWTLHGCWIDLIRREVIERHALRFDEDIYHEDILFSLRLYGAVRRSMCTNRATYLYRQRAQSIMALPMSPHRVFSYTMCMERIAQCIAAPGHSQRYRQALLSHFYRLMDNRYRYLDAARPAEDTADWPADIADAYALFYSFTADCRLICDHLPLLAGGQRVFLFSDGRAGAHLLRALHLYDVAIDGVLVPEAGAAQAFFGHRIRPLDALTVDPAGDVFVLACGVSAQARLRALLESRGARHIVAPPPPESEG